LMNKYIPIVLILFFTVCQSSCSIRPGSSDSAPSGSNTRQSTLLPSDTPAPILIFTPEPTYTPSVTPIVILDSEPLVISFTTEDGVDLEGMYYPASENPAPLIVLFHWARGDMTEWEQIALWLQDRDQLVRAPDYNHAWKSSDWFPDFQSGEPLGVFTLTFRGCQDGCSTYSPGEWLLDVEAAMLTITKLQGVDKERIITVGTSIGADGALYGCTWMNQVGIGACNGSFSISPASLLTLPYDELASYLVGLDPPIPVQCLYGLRDDASVETCADLPGVAAVDYGYIENHGFELIQPDQTPDPLVLLNDFINSALAGVGE